MNQYTELLRYLRQRLEESEFINTITTGQDIDINRANIFPLANIEINNAVFTSNATIQFSVQIQCLDLRDINKEIVNDKFYENDNAVDNWNNTLSALNGVWVKAHRGFVNMDITASDSPTVNKIELANENLLDGWELDFNVELPTNQISICEQYLAQETRELILQENNAKIEI